MGELQQWLTEWLGGIAALLPLGFAFGAGMVSTVNPCGFILLPAYLGLFLGVQGTEAGAAPDGARIATRASVPLQAGKAILVASVVTLGFVLLFGTVGVVVTAGGRFIIDIMPWAAVGVGVGLVAAGLAMLRGKSLSPGFAARLAGRLGSPRSASLPGFFVFGLAYALASLSCTFPIFLTVVGTSLAVQGFTAGVAQFIGYALGMGFVILALTVSTAVFQGTLVNALRGMRPDFERFSALLLIVAGGYLLYYWLIEGGLLAAMM